MHSNTCFADDNSETGGERSDPTNSDTDDGTTVRPETAIATIQSPNTISPCNERDPAFVPPINTLPTEVLLLIFEYCHYLWRSTSIKKEREDSPAVWDRSVRSLMSLPCPEALSHVCSMWREIILSTPTIWVFLDLYTLCQSSQTFIERSSAFIPRTQNQDLVLRVRLRHEEDGSPSAADSLKEFCSSTAPRLRSLLVDNHAANDTTLFTSLIQTALPKATPGTLLNLFIKDYGARTNSSQEDNTEGLAGWELPTAELCGISQEALDSIVRPIKSLRLSGQFFPWTSPAYHGLVELHLLFIRPARGRRPFIQGHRLRDLLLASPELRILHINLNVTGEDGLLDLPPVPLNHLEELSLRGMSRGVYDVVLPLLAPGNKPLQFTYQTQQMENAPLYCPAVFSFLQRANVTSLYIIGRWSFGQQLSIDELLTSSPTNLQTLGLERLSILEFTPQAEQTEKFSQLSHLYIRKCAIDVDVFKQLLELLPVQVLKLHRPEFRGRLKGDDVEANREIASMIPIVKRVRSSRDMELWDSWEVEYEDPPEPMHSPNSWRNRVWSWLG
ncbi:hypothetical protein RSOLAG1IB_10253 [Rhizoctonia solani AG-1 IB]|uniref:Uncharacterized protein n=1 Tax=Thanatephorus cucumeris (strain AG1-IB / isolate 7/3/14) TaxID=1108050 RepID=A0A0B7G0Z5_THACB|nr:hypothetical protein RSOLAG1IB_10253 [Rhizoctonia solani AG-1 IB]